MLLISKRVDSLFCTSLLFITSRTAKNSVELIMIKGLL
ncbi:hypothetical protein CBGD1_2389 [Sulfurimonas gotlandica GD1]|nr:hypothetical protein CBGD1_2389 [Sulfurimonas gotlandica GD1]